MTERTTLPQAYRTIEPSQRAAVCPSLPRNIFIEVTNRCNLRCATCPRTFATYEPPHDMSLQEVIAIAEQFPDMERAVLHGIGEPLLNNQLPDMIRYLKDRGVNVLFNSNGVLLDADWQEALAQSGLDEYRLSLDAADPDLYAAIRGRPQFERVVQNLGQFMATLRALGKDSPRVSIWSMAMKDNIEQLPALVRMAAELGVPEVYLQRLTYAVDKDERYGIGQEEQALYGHLRQREQEIIALCQEISRQAGIAFRASGAVEPKKSLSSDASARPWSACLRPWTTAYITANGNALACCIAPFATTQYDELILGNIREKAFAEIWNDEPYRRWRKALLSDAPHPACSGCGVYWSL